MVQDQLVEYISSQTRLGVSRDAIKAALVGAGWAAADVEDTLKKIESITKPAAPAGAPASFSPSTGTLSTGPASAVVSTKPASSTAPASFSPSGTGTTGGMTGGISKGTEPQSIKVSDLVSMGPVAAKSMEAKGPAETKYPGVQQPQMQQMRPAEPIKKGGSLMKIVGIVLIVVFAALAGFFYWQNSTLTAKVASIGSASTDVAASVAALTAQVQAQDASNTALAADVASLTTEKTLLTTNLSFIAVPAGAATSSETVAISGKLFEGKTMYTLTTPYGVLVYVQNTKDAKVKAAFTALGVNTDSVELTGTHVPGSQFITVTAVNGTAL